MTRHSSSGAVARAVALAGLLLPAACEEQAPPEIATGRLVRTEARAARSLIALVPAECRGGEVFRPQPNGDASLVVVGTGLTRSDTVLWNGRPLKTDFASSRGLSVSVPPELLRTPGSVEVTVEDTMDPARPKLRATFVVLPGA